MKRDARIGLAVVLVLGLLVTLLVGRAIYNHAAPADNEGELATATPAQPTGDAKAPGAGGVQSSMPVPANAAVPGQTIVSPPNPAVQKFVEDQTKPLSKDTAGVPSPVIPGNTKGDLTPDQAAALDHEGGPSPMAHTTTTDTPAPATFFAYTIATGDNLWKISSKVYGDGKFTQKIIEANPGMNSQKMRVGSMLKIPTIPNKTILMKLPPFSESAKSGKKTNDPVAADSRDTLPAPAVEDKATEKVSDAKATTHKIAAGDTLSSIAKKYYGASSAKNVEKIISANRGLNASKLRVGQELTIP